MDRNSSLFDLGRTTQHHHQPAYRTPARAPRKLAWNPIGLSAGQVLYREGQLADRVFVTRSGIVKLVTHLPNGRARILGLHGPGAVLGVVTPGGDRPAYPHTAIAVEDIGAAWLPAGQLRRMRNEGAREYVELLERHCEALGDSERWIAELSAGTTPCRIARLIKHLAKLQRFPDPNEVELLTCQEMSEVIGVSTESASRVLADFKRNGVLTAPKERPRKRHYQFNPATLDDIAFA